MNIYIIVFESYLSLINIELFYNISVMQQAQILIAQITAPGKIILSGEHAVVYGKDAIAMAIDLCCHADIYEKEKNEQKACIQMESFGKVYEFQPDKKVDISMQFGQYCEKKKSEGVEEEQIKFEYKCQTFLDYFNLELPLKKFNLKICSKVPIGKCLGSSASFNTVLSACLLLICVPNEAVSLEKANMISKIFEKIQHGTPSGIDNFVATYGGLVLFNNSKNPQFQKITNKNILSRIKEEINVILVDTGKQKNTKKAVEIVRQNCKQQKYAKMIEEIGSFPLKILEIIDEGAEHWFEEVLRICEQNHQYLRQLGVSCPQIEQIFQQYRKPGISCGKITGGGMGGYVLVLSSKYEENKQILNTRLSQSGLKVKKYGFNGKTEIIEDFVV